jgi:hypothetical protein
MNKQQQGARWEVHIASGGREIWKTLKTERRESGVEGKSKIRGRKWGGDTLEPGGSADYGFMFANTPLTF